MSEILETKEKIIICFDASELDTFEACQFKWHLSSHLNLKPKVTKPYLEMGALIHYLLELHYKSKMINPFVEPIKREEIIELGRVKSLEFDLSLEEVGEHIFQYREYARYYEDETTENIIPVAVEEPFLVKIFEDDDLIVYVQGKPDLIFRYSNSNDLILMDHKRVSRDSNISALRNQFLLYCVACQTDTFIVNKVGFQKSYKPKERFKRVPFIYNKEILDEWKTEVVGRAREMILAQQFESYPKNRSSCEKWDGCWYQRYCTTRPSAREFLIGTEFIISESWDVSKGLEDKNVTNKME